MAVELPLTLKLHEAHDLAEGVRELVLVNADVQPLPGWQPGAHIDIEAGEHVRQYSLCGDPSRDDEWRVAVLRDPASRGGSAYLVESLSVGDLLRAGGPRNNFELEDAPSYLFIAGGIGVTPLLPMIRQAIGEGRDVRVVYGARSEGAMSYRDVLAEVVGPALTLVPQDRSGPIDLAAILQETDRGTTVYCCGPEGLLAAAEAQCAARGLQLRLERFAPRDVGEVTNTAIEVELADSGITLEVPPDVSILEAVEEAGVFVLSNCEEGTCGTCVTQVLEGVPEHRDSYLDEEERESGEQMCICVSRACTRRLVLDL